MLILYSAIEQVCLMDMVTPSPISHRGDASLASGIVYLLFLFFSFLYIHLVLFLFLEPIITFLTF